MAIVSAIINRSLRLLNAIDAGSATPALDSQTAIVALNAMLTGWESNGLAMGWANVATVDDTMPTLDEDEEAIVYNLAMRLAPEYPPPTTLPGTNDFAKQFLAELRRRRLTEMPLEMRTSLPPSQRYGHFNILTDEPN